MWAMRSVSRGAAGPLANGPGVPGEFDGRGQDIQVRLARCLTGQFGQSNSHAYAPDYAGRAADQPAQVWISGEFLGSRSPHVIGQRESQ